MKASINVHLVVNGTRTLKCGVFQVSRSEDIPKVVHDWIRKIRRETGYYGLQSIIEKVIVDGDQEITDIVKVIDNRPIQPLDDVFW
jgi:disulfide oxidoreductase YuzD